jgi:hypothetical protein
METRDWLLLPCALRTDSHRGREGRPDLESRGKCAWLYDIAHIRAFPNHTELPTSADLPRMRIIMPVPDILLFSVYGIRRILDWVCLDM